MEDVTSQDGERPQRGSASPSAPVLAIVVPCYNEAPVLPRTLSLLLDELELLRSEGSIDACSRLLLVDDGSTDGTWRLIADAAARDGRIMGVSLSRNSGFQNALMAGLMEGNGPFFGRRHHFCLFLKSSYYSVDCSQKVIFVD